jgi:lantibiotic biosynthesis protein
MYQHLDAALVRLPAWDARSLALPWPDLDGAEATAVSWRAWLDQVWQVPELASAVEAASPDLARQAERIRGPGGVPDAAVRRTVLATLRYLLRGTSRATPFGLLAGIAPARIGPRTVLRPGSGHRTTARPDATWLTGVIEALEADDGLRQRLRVTASDLVTERDGFLVISYRPGKAPGAAPQRVQVRATRPARAALETARSPVLVSDLAGGLAAAFPAAAGDAIGSLVAQLISLGFLRTSLRAPATAPDPLAVLLAQLETAAPCDARTGGLRAVSAALTRCSTTSDPAAARGERRQAAALMRSIHAAAGPVIATDLRAGWDLAVPAAVAAEVAAAADVMARLARRPVLNQGWAAWHARFLDRYGPGAAVPVLEVTDPAAGLGFPAGFLGSGQDQPASPLAERDKTLLKLAQQAVLRGEQEIVLDDTLIGTLAVAGPGDPVQPSAELTIRIHAASPGDLDSGRFTLHVVAASRAAGTVTGRFLHLLDATDRDRMLGVYAALPGIHQGSRLAHISAAPIYTRSGNVSRAPQAAPLLISLGEYREGAAAEQVPVSGLAVTADAQRLHLVSVRGGWPVHTILPSAVDLSVHTHPLARFLLEAPVALAAPCTAFDWGAASALPFVPALRYRRTVLSPARWMLDAADLPGQDANWPRWDTALTSWAEQARLPGRVYAGDGDRCVALDLAEPSHRTLLRAQLDRDGHARLRPAPAPGDLGWAGEHPHEVTIPVAITGPPLAPVRPTGEITVRSRGHLPGCDGRIYLKLYAPPDLQAAILTRHLPDLTARLGSRAICWFIRYQDPEPHLRLRVTLSEGSSGQAGEQAGAWTSTLRDHGLITHVSWETYFPETARFGGLAVMGSAEAFFAADSAAAVAQLLAAQQKDGPDQQALTAASMAELAASAAGDRATGMRWLRDHARSCSVPPLRALYDQAVCLVREPGPGKGGVPAAVAEAWAGRRAALAAYRSALEDAGTVTLTGLLPDLLHLHHTRIAGPDIAAEGTCLHLARAAALSWLARSTDRAA